MNKKDYIGSTSFFWSPEKGIVVKSLHPDFVDKYAVHLNVERQILKRLGRHERIVQYLGFHEAPPEGIRLVEANNGTLQTYLDTYGGFIEQATRMSLAGQLIDAIEFIHSRDVIHSDIRPENCLLESINTTLNLLLCDFGGSMCSALALDGLGLPDAPFWNLEWETTPHTDIFAAGSTLYCIMTGVWPFKHDTVTESKLEFEDRVNGLIKQGAFPETQAIIGGQAIATCWTKRQYTATEIRDTLQPRTGVVEEVEDSFSLTSQR